jgi:hypothetical protein
MATAIPATSKKTVRAKRTTARKEGAIMRALRKVARMGASAGRRAKSAAKRLARMVKEAALKVGRAVKRAALKVASVAAPVARQIARPFVYAFHSRPVQKMLELGRAAWARVKTAWQKVLKPFLQDVGTLFAFGGFVAGLTFAPLTTALITGTAGLTALALSKGVGWLERSKSKLALAVRNGLEVIAQVMRVMAYVGTGFLTVVGAALSLPFAFAALMEIVLRSTGVISTPSLLQQVTVSSQVIAVKAKSMLTAGRRSRAKDPDEKYVAEAQKAMIQEGEEASVALREVLEEMREETQVVETPVIEVQVALTAQGTEELQGTTHDAPRCDVCGTAAPELTLLTAALSPTGVASQTCETCFEPLEEEALRLTGVSLKARHVRVPLTQLGIEHTQEYKASKADASLQWLVTARWRDRNGLEKHVREWSLLDNGDIVGTVAYDHQAKTWTATALGEVLKTGERAAGPARRMVWDVIIDARNAVINEAAKTEHAEKEGAVTHLAHLLGGLIKPAQPATKKG